MGLVGRLGRDILGFIYKGGGWILGLIYRGFRRWEISGPMLWCEEIRGPTCKPRGVGEWLMIGIYFCTCIVGGDCKAYAFFGVNG